MAELKAEKGMFTTDGHGAVGGGSALDFEVRAAVLWWSRQDGEGVEPGNRGGLGFWAPGAGVSIAWASDDDVTPTRTATRAADKALIGLESADGELAMEAEDLSFAAGGTVLRWSTSPTERWIVHFLALGGDGLAGARLGWVASPTAPGPARLDLTDVRPDLVLFGSTRADSRLAPVSGLSIGVGAASGCGQAAAGYASRHGAPSGDVGGAQRSDAAALLVRDRHELALLGSMALGDGGDPVLDWAVAGPDRHLVCYLALEGPHCTVGTAVSPTKPGARRTRVGFRPDALLFYTWGLPSSAEPTDIGRLCVGAAGGGKAGCSSWDDRDWGASRAATHVSSSSRDVVAVTNTQTGSYHAAASLARVDGDSFTLDWSVSDGKYREVAYVALGSRPAAASRGRLRGWLLRIASVLGRARR